MKTTVTLRSLAVVALANGNLLRAKPCSCLNILMWSGLWTTATFLIIMVTLVPSVSLVTVRVIKLSVIVFGKNRI